MVRNYFKYFIEALGTFSALATLISFLLMWKSGDNTSTDISIWGIIGWGALMLAICAAYAFWMIKKKSRIELMINANFRLTIEKGDLFSKEGIIVIPVNEYFDTIVNEVIISRNTVHGAWINRYWKDRIQELDGKIADGMAALHAEGITGTEVEGRGPGKEVKYPVGTCIPIRDGMNTYVLCALTYFDSNNKAYLPRKEFSNVIEGLFDCLKQISTDKPVYLPLFGTGLSRLNRSRQRILSFFVEIIDFKYSDANFPKGVHIEIRSDAFQSVDLNQIEYHFKHTFHADR